MISEERKQIYLREGVIAYCRYREDYFNEFFEPRLLKLKHPKQRFTQEMNEYEEGLKDAKEILDKKEDALIISKLEKGLQKMKKSMGVQNDK